jgi:hypothetical protein
MAAADVRIPFAETCSSAAATLSMPCASDVLQIAHEDLEGGL